MKESVNIVSDFIDCYDYLSSPNGLIYERKLSKNTRGHDLKFLRSLGLKTIEIKPVNQFSYLDEKLVVYTKSNGHDGTGKKICNYIEAMEQYASYPASKFISLDETNGCTIKTLQIGSRRFNIFFRKEYEDLEHGKIVNITEASRDFNNILRLPIFSIDYINKGNELIATDFNSVQKLDSINILEIMTADSIIKEIYEALVEYRIY